MLWSLMHLVYLVLLLIFFTFACGDGSSPSDASTALDASSMRDSGSEEAGPTNDGANGGDTGAPRIDAGDGSTRDGGAVTRPRLLIVGTGDWNPAVTGRVAVSRFDPTTGDVQPLRTTDVGTLPSFMAIDGPRRLLHVGDEVSGTVRTMAIATDGALNEVGSIEASPTRASNPVYVALGPSRTRLFVSHYELGLTEMFALDGGGVVDRALDRLDTGGQSHSVLPLSDSRLISASKATDQVIRLDVVGETLVSRSSTSTASGSGPRHVAAHPSGRYVYLVNENDVTLNSFGYNDADGSISTLTRGGSPLPALSLEALGATTGLNAADVHVHPSGAWLYASLRLDDADGELVRCALDGDGVPTVIDRFSTRGRTPRNFAIDPSGAWLAVANQTSDNVVLFRLEADGRLTYHSMVDTPGNPFFVTLAVEPG